MRAWPRRAILTGAAGLAGLGAACEPEYNWRDVALAAAVVQLPCRAERSQRAVRLGQREWPMEMVACDRGGLTWAALSVRAPGADAAALARELRAAMAANLNADAAESAPAAQGGFADGVFGPTVQLQGRRPDGSPTWAQLSYAHRGEQVVELVALLPRAPAAAQQAALGHFRTSLRWQARP